MFVFQKTFTQVYVWQNNFFGVWLFLKRNLWCIKVIVEQKHLKRTQAVQMNLSERCYYIGMFRCDVTRHIQKQPQKCKFHGKHICKPQRNRNSKMFCTFFLRIECCSYLLGFTNKRSNEIFDILRLVPLEVYLRFCGSKPVGNLWPAQLQQRRLPVGHHGEISPWSELGHRVPLLYVHSISTAILNATFGHIFGDIAYFQRGKKVHFSFVMQDLFVLLLSVLQQRVGGEPSGFVVAELERCWSLSPGVLRLLQPVGELSERFTRRVRRRTQSLWTDHFHDWRLSK